MTTEPSDLFISYPSGDLPAVTRLAEDLRGAGLAVWYAESELRAGHWRTRVEDAIDAASVFVLIISPRTGRSNEVENEFRRAEAARRPIIAAFVEDAIPPLYAASLQHVRFDLSVDESLAKVAALVQNARKQRRLLEIEYLEKLKDNHVTRAQPYAPLIFEPLSEGISNTPPDVEKLVNAALARFDASAAGTATSNPLLEGIFRSRGPGRSRVSLVGEPGAGKTTTLLELLSELTTLALAEPEAPVPLYVPLKHFGSSVQFADYMKNVGHASMGELAGHIPELLSSGRLALLIDGLNEVPRVDTQDCVHDIRKFLERHPGIFVAVTCLVAEYTPERSLGLSTFAISPLTPPQVRSMIGDYITNESERDELFWSLLPDGKAVGLLHDYVRMGGDETAFWLHKGDSPVANYFQWNLWLRVRDDPLSLLTLARNPYLLSIIIRVYMASGRLVPNRYQLFAVFVEVLCTHHKEQVDREGGFWQAIDEQSAHLATIAHAMHLRGSLSLPRADVLGLLPEPIGNEILGLAEAEKILDASDDVSFSHQLLREYFAAHYLERLWRDGQSFGTLIDSEEWWASSSWEQSVIFLGGKHSHDPIRLLNWIRDPQPELTSQCLLQAGCAIDDGYVRSLAAAWLPRLQSDREPAQGRAAIGRALGRIEIDARPGVSLLDRQGLPVVEWTTVGRREVTLGGASLLVRSFDMSRYLVTNAQFQPFLDDGGYTERHRDCWTDAGWDWKSISDRRGPDDYTEVFRLSNHPRIGTVWYEVVAYTRWLSKRLRESGELPAGTEVRLPTEAEWQAAATGADGTWAYPWGNDFSYDCCNVVDVRSTTAVGIYPKGASPEGVFDLIGNAWSWCLTNWDDDPTAQDNALEGDGPRVYRGGSWAFDFNVSRWRSDELRSDQRYWIDPLDDRPDALGFFLVRGESPTS